MQGPHASLTHSRLSHRVPMPYQACLGTGHQGEQHGEEPSQAPAPWQPLTDDDEGHGDGVGQQIAAHRLLVLAIALPEEADQWVQLVLTQALWAQEDVLALGWAPAPLPCPTAPRPPPPPGCRPCVGLNGVGRIADRAPGCAGETRWEMQALFKAYNRKGAASCMGLHTNPLFPSV